jgi:hypothetical protein
MRDKKIRQQDIMPENFNTLDELGQFWDTHSTADYEDDMEPVDVEIDLVSSKIYLPVAKDLLQEVRVQARRQGVSTETLINLWLQEKLHTSV